MKIYISGQITGLEIAEAEKLFNQAETHLCLKGHDVVNPMTLPHNHDKTWQSYMKEDIIALCGCDAIFMLDNWRQSKGATYERSIALTIGLRVCYWKHRDLIKPAI